MNAHSFSAKTVEGDSVPLSDYAGKLMLIVNVASKCGFTPQYEGLEALHRELKDSGLQVLGFPCNQFGGQEPGTDAEIQEFCSVNYSVTFPVFAKIDVNGDDADPLYQYLRAADPGTDETDAIKWNFTKFLVGRDGEVIRRIDPKVTPAEFRDEVAAVLA